MNVGKTSQYSAPVAQTNAPKTASEASQNKNTTYAADNVVDNKDKFEQETSTYSPAYTKGSSKSNKSNNARTEFDGSKSARQMKNEAMQGMVRDTLSKQSSGKVSSMSGYSPLNTSSTIMNALQAAEATSEGKDYWGVDATAERIFTFAKNLAGDDEEMLGKMRKAFETGFKLAAGSRGGSLPSISYQTRDKVNSLFDDYEKSLADKKAASTTEETADTTKTDAAKSNDKAAETKTDSKKYANGTVPYFGNARFGSSYTEK